MTKERTKPAPASSSARRTSPEKMMEILDLFDEQHLSWMPEQMMERLQCPRSTLYRYLRVLTGAGLVTSLPDTGYTLGPRIVELDYMMRSGDPMVSNGRPLLQEVVKEIPGIGLLCRYFKDRVLCVHQETSASEIHSSYERGRAMPIAYGATSRIILAHLRLPQLRQLYALQPREFSRTGSEKGFEQLQEDLRAIRKQGYCQSQGEVTPGVVGVAAPVFDSEGTIIGSLSMVVPETGFNERRRRLITDRIVFSARVLTNSMRPRQAA